MNNCSAEVASVADYADSIRLFTVADYGDNRPHGAPGPTAQQELRSVELKWWPATAKTVAAKSFKACQQYWTPDLFRVVHRRSVVNDLTQNATEYFMIEPFFQGIPPTDAQVERMQPDRNPEHPPLGKEIIAAGLALFGDDPWGWRFFPVLAGSATMFAAMRAL